jgi:hypothetical protein
MPPIPFIATFLSTAYLKFGAIRMNADAQDRLEDIAKIIEGMDDTVDNALNNNKGTEYGS